jgi:hypothetical protein
MSSGLIGGRVTKLRTSLFRLNVFALKSMVDGRINMLLLLAGLT